MLVVYIKNGRRKLPEDTMKLLYEINLYNLHCLCKGDPLA
jgi:hypothetical protein